MVPDDLSDDISKFNALMIRMADDEALYQEYLDNPHKVLAREGISQRVIKVLLEGSAADVQALAAQAGAVHPWIIVR